MSVWEREEEKENLNQLNSTPFFIEHTGIVFGSIIYQLALRNQSIKGIEFLFWLVNISNGLCHRSSVPNLIL